MITAEGKIRLELDPNDVQAILMNIRLRQQDCKKVYQVPEYPADSRKIFYDLDLKLEKVKMNIVGQMQ